MHADAQDKALVFQADANTSLLAAIRQVPAPHNMFEKSKIVMHSKASRTDCRHEGVGNIYAGSCGSGKV